MALLIDASSPAIATGAGTTVTTASFTPPAGSLLLIEMSGNSTSGTPPGAPTITDNLGSHLVYALSNWVSEGDSPFVAGQCAIWTAPVPTTTAMTVSVTVDPSAPEHAVKVTVLTGHDPSGYLGASGEAGSTSASSIAQSYNGQATSGQGFGVTCDWDFKGNQTAGSGCTIQSGNVGSQFNYGFVRRTADDDTLGVGNSLNVTLPGSSTHLSWCWLEILPLVVNQDLVDPPPYIFFHPPGQFSPNGIWAPWQGVPDSTYQPLQLVVTATETGTTNNGISLLVRMLTGADPVQPGVSNASTSITTPNLAITPGATGSWVYGALINANSSTAWTANGSTTMQANSVDATNGAVYGHYRSTATTTASTPVTLGASAPTGGTTGGLAQAEIKSLTGLAEDAGAPALALATNAITVSTTRFTALAGCVLVATVCSDSGAGVVSITVTGGGLVWTEVAKANASSAGYAGIWFARIPALPAAPSADTTVAAECADGAGGADDAGTDVRVAGDVAPGTGLADNPTVVAAATTNAPAECATGTGLAGDAGVAVAVAGGAAAGSGLVDNPAPTVAVAGDVAPGTGLVDNPTVSTVTVTNAPAEAATGTGLTDNPVPALAVSAEQSAGTGLVDNPTVLVNPAAGNAAGTGLADNPVAALAVPAECATGSGLADNPAASIAVAGDQAAGTGVANDATVSTQSLVNAPAECATGTGLADNPVPGVGFDAATATGTGLVDNPAGLLGATPAAATGSGLVDNPTVTLAAPGGQATGSGLVDNPGPALAVAAESASGTGQVDNPTVSTLTLTNAPAECATGSGLVDNPGVSTTAAPAAECATGSGDAGQPTPVLAGAGGVGIGTGQAGDATVLTGAAPSAGLASGTAQAGDGTALLAVLAELAAGTGETYLPTLILPIIATYGIDGSATSAGIDPGRTTTASPDQGLLTATGSVS